MRIVRTYDIGISGITSLGKINLEKRETRENRWFRNGKEDIRIGGITSLSKINSIQKSKWRTNRTNHSPWVFPFPAKRVEVPAVLLGSWRNRNWTCGYIECIFWKAVMRYTPPTCCLRRLKDPSHSTAQHQKLDVRQIISNKYIKTISLNDVETSKNIQRLGKISDVFSEG